MNTDIEAIKARADAGRTVRISDVKALIAEVERLEKHSENLRLDYIDLLSKFDVITAERDAAVEDIYASANDPYHCGICKKRHIKCEANPDGSCQFEWRGERSGENG